MVSRAAYRRRFVVGRRRIFRFARSRARSSASSQHPYVVLYRSMPGCGSSVARRRSCVAVQSVGVDRTKLRSSASSYHHRFPIVILLSSPTQFHHTVIAIFVTNEHPMPLHTAEAFWLNACQQSRAIIGRMEDGDGSLMSLLGRLSRASLPVLDTDRGLLNKLVEFLKSFFRAAI